VEHALVVGSMFAATALRMVARRIEMAACDMEGQP
jgi:hypothetical protein